MDINTNMKHEVIRWMEWNWTGRFGLLVRFGRLKRLLTGKVRFFLSYLVRLDWLVKFDW